MSGADKAAVRLSSPAAGRNVGPIGDVLDEWLPDEGLVLEVASGSGEHALAFARRFPALQWQASDPSAEAVASIADWRVEGPINLLDPRQLDATDSEWPVERADAVLCINMVHIAPWPAAIGLIEGSARILTAGAPLILYGPWLVDGEETAPSNLAFDRDLRARDPRWGLRRVAAFADEAFRRGFDLVEQRSMPANNRMLLFRRAR